MRPRRWGTRKVYGMAFNEMFLFCFSNAFLEEAPEELIRWFDHAAVERDVTKEGRAYFFPEAQWRYEYGRTAQEGNLTPFQQWLKDEEAAGRNHDEDDDFRLYCTPCDYEDKAYRPTNLGGWDDNPWKPHVVHGKISWPRLQKDKALDHVR